MALTVDFDAGVEVATIDHRPLHLVDGASVVEPPAVRPGWARRRAGSRSSTPRSMGRSPNEQQREHHEH